MQLSEAKQQFISAWGGFGSNWGINRTMAQIHALLLISPSPISAETVMAELNISRGNANMNLRELINWGLVERVMLMGERREFFSAEKDIWTVARTIVKERKRRELEPMLKLLDTLAVVESGENPADEKAFVDTIANIKKFSQHANSSLDTLIKADEHWFFSTLLKLLK
ncbi:MAG: transcriptional regulator [Bacteroidetes bacterium]|nr:MAG: transcriptional regulator [Bacteroidota bacterium]